MTISQVAREALSNEWKRLTPDKESKIKLGQAIFQKLFSVHPEFLKLFKKLEGLGSLDVITESTELKAHGLRFVNALSGVFETLDDPNELGDMLKHVGSSHKIRNVTCEHFNATVPILQEVLLSKFESLAAKEALKIVLSVAGPIIMQGYED